MIKANINETELRNKIISLAMLQYKKIYKHGKKGPEVFDCAGLVWYVYNVIFNLNLYSTGVGLSTTTKIMTNKYGNLITFKENDISSKDLSLIKNGDIVFFHRQSLQDNYPTENNKFPGHCGIYLGEQKFIHASRIKQRVVISDFTKNNYWLKVLVGSKNIFVDNTQNSLVYKK